MMLLLAANGLFGQLISIVILLAVVAGGWKVFEKAGKPGWAVLVPIFNIVVLLDIVGKPVWWILLFLIPVVNFVVLVIICLEIAKRFGKSPLYGVGLLLLGFVFFPLLGFSDATYNPNA